jgi:hypothetical protein
VVATAPFAWKNVGRLKLSWCKSLHSNFGFVGVRNALAKIMAVIMFTSWFWTNHPSMLILAQMKMLENIARNAPKPIKPQIWRYK